MKVELANDFLARKIYEAASIDDKARAVARNFIENSYIRFCGSPQRLLSHQELAFIQPYLDRLSLNSEHKNYIEQSRQKLQRTRRRKRLREGSVVALICIVILSSWGIWERNRYTTTHQNLAIAQDSIGRLLQNTTSRNNNEKKNITPAPTTAFHTLYIKGRISNMNGKPVQEATIQVLGATIKSDHNGYYEIYLVLPPKYWSEAPKLYVKKEYYQEEFHVLDLDKDQLEWNPILKPQY